MTWRHSQKEHIFRLLERLFRKFVLSLQNIHILCCKKDNIVKKLYTTLLLLAITLCAAAQWEEPVEFSVSQKQVSDKEIVIRFEGKIDQGWHVYSTDVGEGGPTPATFNIDEAKGVRPNGKLRAIGNATRKHDPVFDMELSFFENRCVFEQRLTITEPEYSAKGYLEYGACNDRNCTPPTAVDFEIKGTLEASANEDEVATTPLEDNSISASDSAQAEEATADSSLWSSRINKIKSLQTEDSASAAATNAQSEESSLFWLFLMGMLGGLIALLTPCVWPIIPMTVSFFLKRASERSKGIRDAVLYGLSIIVIYMLLAVVVTLIFGTNAANALSTNAVVNIFFFLMLVVFGLSLLGCFELELPSSWSNKADRKAEATTGLLSIFIMAFTLALVSFSCTGPIVGLMLVEIATMQSVAGPLICMFGFALALALPFTLFALFPSMLKKMPKSGSWMQTIKVILGFVEIAFSLKFFSVADMAYGWHILSRELFLIIWIILALALGIWLLWKPKWQRSKGAANKFNPLRYIRGGIYPVLAALCFWFAAYMVPGVLGKPLGLVSAFAPPMSMQHIRLYGENVEAKFTDYEQGMAYAKEHGKRVLIDFTGFGCVNCREMEMNVWNDSEVAAYLRDSVVLISLFVDDKTKLPHPVQVTGLGNKPGAAERTITLRTVGDKWSYLQAYRFGANVQPFYVLTSPDGEPIAAPYSYDTSVEKFLNFLKTDNKN
ncbi:MAG: thioredoxin family protein [Prevotellaceae bacterium]|nr:thioredoxin family protein [Prevotellaceae bacterium]